MLFKCGVLPIVAAAMAFAQVPTITAVQDAAAYTANIPQGAVFVVKGANLTTGGQPASVPYPTTLNGVSITFTPVAGGAVTKAFMVYTYNQGGVTQLAAVLPSATPTGDYNVTVTNSTGTGAAFRTTVVARKFGLITAAGSGSGRAALQNVVTQTQYDLNRFTTGTLAGYTYSPAKPGQYMIAWGTGLGAVGGDDNQAPGVINFLDQGVAIAVIVGTTEITPSYAGRAPQFPGADQLVFQLPPDLQTTGCEVPIQVRVAGQLSNTASIAIAPNAQAGACVDSRFTQDVMSRLDQGGSLVMGLFELTSVSGTNGIFTGTSEGAVGGFALYNADQMSALPDFLDTGACQVYRATTNSAGEDLDFLHLDAGRISLNGPNVANRTVGETAGHSYSLDLGITTGTPLIAAGSTYTLTGSGGKDVGDFQVSFNFGPALAIKGSVPATVTRSQDLPIAWTWTGGGSGLAIVTGSASVANGGTAANPTYQTVRFACSTGADKLAYTVPSSILMQLPATPSGNGTLSVVSASPPTSSNGLFTPPLVAGGAAAPLASVDYGVFLGGIGSGSAHVTYK
jgi:uncharacterized protein (TIGR03437 family)